MNKDLALNEEKNKRLTSTQQFDESNKTAVAFNEMS